MDAWTLWRGQPDTNRRALVALLFFSILLHLPLTPLGSFWSLFGLLGPTEDIPPAPPLTVIPLDLIEDESLAGPTPAPTPPPPPEPAIVADPEGERHRPDAGAPQPDAGPPDAGPVDAGPTDADAGPTDAGVASDAGLDDAGISDPIAFKGAAAKVVDPNANVQVRIYNARIRQHPLGPRVGRMLGSVYQWRDFFGPTGLDPIRDVDQMVVVGPQFRDSSGVAAILKLNVPDDRVRLAIEALVKSDPDGGWLDAGVPQATARADRAPRVFTLPSPGIVVVTPPGGTAESATKLPRNYTLRDGGGSEVLTALIKTPWRALRGTNLKISQSIKLVRLRLTPTPDGGALIEIDAEDESPELASKNAIAFRDDATFATQFVLPLMGLSVKKLDFSAQGSKILGRVELTEQQVLAALNYAQRYLPPMPDAGSGAQR